MKKRLLSALLALALVFVLLPTTALADTTPVTDENVKINGTAVIVGNDISLGEGNGTYSYDKATHTLTLNSATINATGSNIGIEFCDTTNYVTYSVILTGENTVTSNNIAIETTSNTNLTLAGGGNLKAITNGNHQAIRVYGTLTIENSTLIAESSAYTATTVIWTLAMTGNNAKLEISNKSAANIVAGTAGASKNIDWSNYQFTTGSYSGDALTESDPEVCSWGTLNEYLGFPTKKYSQYICIAKRTIPALEKDSYVYIAGGPAVVGVRTSLGEGNGYYTYNKDTKTFTFENVNITSVTNAIQLMADGTYTIKLVGTNTISDVSAGIVASNLYGANDITAVLSGTGSLDITAGHYAINMQTVGNLKFENTGTIKLTTGYKYPASTCNALYVVGNVTIDKTKYDIKGEKQAQGFPTEDIGSSPDLETILKGTDSTLYFKTITIAPKPSKTYYNNKAMGYGETRIVGSGTISCDENGVITMTNVNDPTGTLSFEATYADSTLVLEGTNTLSSIVTTKKGLTISGSGSLTAGSIRVTNNYNIHADLTINGGAHVTVNRPSSEDEPAVEVSGNLTVTGDGTQLSAECTAATNPAIEVGGNASFTGSTVTITNNSDRQGKSGEYSYEVSTGLYVGGTLDIKNAAKVTSTVIGGNAIYAKGDITISGDSTEVNAQNSAYKFSAISTNGTVNISDNSTVKAENLKKHQGDPTGVTDPSTGKTYNACPAITGKIANKNSQNKLHIAGFTTSSAGSQNPTEGTPLYLDIAPGSVEPYIHHYYVTITRGDEVAHTESPIVIAGTTLLNDTYYTITDGSTVVANGSKGNYNAIYDSASKTLKLNNAQISHSFAHENGGGRDGAIIFKEFENYFIELSGENTISSTNTYAINCHRPDRTLTIKNAAEAENAKLTLTSNWMVICSIGGLNIQSDVTMVNTKEAGYLMYVNDTFSFDGYNAYASVNASGSPLVEYTVPTSGDKDAGYQYLRITKETLETGGGSTHQHVWDEAWHDTGDYHHAHQCTICKAYDTTTQELHNVTGHRDNHDGSHSNICGSCGYSAKVSHSYTWAPNANDNEKHIGTCVCGNVVEKNHNFVGDVCSDCGYDKSTGTTCEHVWTTEWTIDTVDNEYHWHKCIKCNAITDKKPHAYTIVTDSGTNHIRECECKVFYVEDHISSDWIIDAPATPTTAGSMHKECTVCKHKMQTEVIPATGEIVPPTPDNPGTIVIIRPAEEEKPAQQPNPSTGANDLVGLAVAAAVAAALGSAALLRKHD